MNYQSKEIKNGIKLHLINTNKFKTNLVAIFLTTELNRENVTKNAVISALLRRGSKNMKSTEEISINMEEMYGAAFDCGLDKTGDNQVLKFYIETISDDFLPQNDENMLITSIEKLVEIVFDPYIENNKFNKQYLEQEKNTIKKRIEGKIDNKSTYAINRCIEEMFKNKPYGLYKFGYIEDLENINEENLYEYYKELITNCKIDIFISGNVDEKIYNEIESNKIIKELKERNPKYIGKNIKNDDSKKKENVIKETMNVTQGKLIIGLDLNAENDDEKYNALVYNAILRRNCEF